MNNSVLSSQAGVPACGWPLSAAVTGAAAPGSLGGLLRSGVRRPARPKLAVARQIPAQKYEHMTRLAVTDGDASGSHPAWDPV